MIVEYLDLILLVCGGNSLSYKSLDCNYDGSINLYGILMLVWEYVKFQLVIID